MYKEYGLFNHHIEDTVLLLFSDASITKEVKEDEVAVLYHDEEVIGYKIFNFLRYAKIKYSGIIFLPSNILIDVINNILINHNLETLDYKKESGYVTKMNENRLMVYAKEGTFLRDETISKGRFCTYHDLFILDVEDVNSLLVIDEDIKEGIDFFKMEEK